MDKAIKLSVLAGVLIIAFSISYRSVIRPMLNERRLTICLQEANKQLEEARENYEVSEEKRMGRMYLDTKAKLTELEKRAEKSEEECFLRYPL